MASVANASARAVAAALKGKVFTAEQLTTLTKPTFVNGHWRGAELNGRAVNRLRKEYLIRGEEFPLPRPATRNDRIDDDKKPKGHKKLLVRAKRVVVIKDNMKNMPAMIEEFRKERREQKIAKAEKEKIIPLVPELPTDWMTQAVLRWPSVVVPTWPTALGAKQAEEQAAKDAIAQPNKSKAAEVPERGRRPGPPPRAGTKADAAKTVAGAGVSGGAGAAGGAKPAAAAKPAAPAAAGAAGAKPAATGKPPAK